MRDRATELFEKEAATATKSIVSGIVKLLILFAALFFAFGVMVGFIGGAAFGATVTHDLTTQASWAALESWEDIRK